MTSRRFVHWIFVSALFVTLAAEANAGPVKIWVEGELTGPAGQKALEGTYPVTVRLWNGGSNPILSIDSVRIRVLNGKFHAELGPYAPLNRETYSPKKSISFQFPGEAEINPRTPFMSLAPSGRIHCAPARLTTANMPATDAGTRVRLGFAGDKSATGVLLAMNSQRIELLDPTMPEMTKRFAFDSVTSIDVSARFRRHGQVGLLAGIALGAVAGYAMGSGEEDDLSMSKETKRAFDSFAGAILGGLTGYLIGNSVTTDRWQELPLDRVRDRARNGEDILATQRK